MKCTPKVGFMSNFWGTLHFWHKPSFAEDLYAIMNADKISAFVLTALPRWPTVVGHEPGPISKEPARSSLGGTAGR